MIKSLSRSARCVPFLVAGLLLVTLLAACGKKGPVRPRLAALPEAPAELRIDQQGGDFLLSWSMPAANTDGTPTEDLAAFRIYRLVYAAAAGCPNCRDPEQLATTVTLNHPAPAVRIGKRLYWRDPGVAPGAGHAYLVATVTVGGHEGGKARAERAWLMPPPAPVLQATAGERRIDLRWTPAALPAGQELVGYNLYRRSAGEPFPPVALNTAPVTEEQLTDFAAPPGRVTGYRLTTVVRSGDQLLESPPSAEVEAIAAPTGAE